MATDFRFDCPSGRTGSDMANAKVHTSDCIAMADRQSMHYI